MPFFISPVYPVPAIMITFSVKFNIEKFDLVITLCGDAKDKCPTLNVNKHVHWDIPDPANFKGNESDTKQKYSEVRELILDKIKIFKREENL